MITAKDNKYVKDITYESADEFLKAISYGGELYNLFKKDFIFRGHSSDKYKLQPYALREIIYYRKYNPSDELSQELNVACSSQEFLQIFTEYKMLEDFFKKCDESKLFIPEVRYMRELIPWDSNGISFFYENGEWLPENLYDLATLAQHHGIPTRLLDWTQDIIIALYFAVSGVINKLESPEKLSFIQWQQKALNNINQFRINRKKRREINLKDQDISNIELWALDINPLFVELKNNPLRIIRPRYFENENLCAQKGILTLWRTKKPISYDSEKGIGPILKFRDFKTLDEHICEFLNNNNNNVPIKPYLYRITIPKTEVFTLYDYVKYYGCDAAHLFPGYDGVVKCLQEDDIVNKNKNNK